MRGVLTIAYLSVLLLGTVGHAQEPDGARLLRSCGATVKQLDGLKVSDEEIADSLW